MRMPAVRPVLPVPLSPPKALSGVRWTRWLALAGLAVTLPLGAAHAEASMPEVRVDRVRGAPVEGRLVAVEADAIRVRTEGGTEETLSLDQVVALHTSAGLAAAKARSVASAGPAPAAPADEASVLWRATLVQGEVLVGRRAGFQNEGETLVLAVEGVGEVALPIDVMRRLDRLPSQAGACPDLDDVHPPRKGQDVVYDEAGDGHAGTLIGYADDGVRIEDARERVRRFPWDRVRTCHVAGYEPSEPVPTAYVEVALPSGSRLRAPPGLTVGSDGRARFRTLSLPKREIELPLATVGALRWSGGAVVSATKVLFTTEIETQAEDHPDVAVDQILRRLRAVRVDHRARGTGACPLQVGGVRYRHGFAVYSVTRIRLALDGQFTTFRVGVGIDDQVMGVPLSSGAREPVRGLADARIVADGKELWAAPRLEGGKAAYDVGTLDVSGVKELVLEVGLGPDGMNTLDRVDWVDPVLVRAR